MSNEAVWRFHCVECGVGDQEFGHLLAVHEVYCAVCQHEDGRLVRLRRWEIIEVVPLDE